MHHHNGMELIARQMLSDAFDAFTEEEHILCKTQAEKQSHKPMSVGSICTGFAITEAYIQMLFVIYRTRA